MTPQPRLVLTAEDPSFDSVTIQKWKDEGYNVTYLPFTGSRRDFERNLQHLADPLEMGEKYAIVGMHFSYFFSLTHPKFTQSPPTTPKKRWRYAVIICHSASANPEEKANSESVSCLSVRRICDRGTGCLHQTDAEAVHTCRLLSRPDHFACCGLPPESPCLSPFGRIARDGRKVSLVLLPRGAAWFC